MIKKILILALGISLLSLACTSSRSAKPKHFLNKEEMTNLITDIRITEVLLYNEHVKHYNEDSIRLQTQQAYAPIFKKYGITYKDYEENMTYYVSQPALLESIFKQVSVNLDTLRHTK